jgi:arabinogalactan endo-1,4-beta-galactosidase
LRISEAFPSNYLRATDLQGRNIKVTIDRIEMEEIGDDRKPILYFVGKEKGVVLNKTNANNIAAAYGDNTDDWQGAEVVLYEAMVDFQGKTVAAIRIRIPPRTPVRQRSTPEQETPPAAPPPSRDPDDDIPF